MKKPTTQGVPKWSKVQKSQVEHTPGPPNLITFRNWSNNNSFSSCNMLCPFFKCFTPTQSAQSNFPETLPSFPSIHLPPHFYKASYVHGLHHLSSVAKVGLLFLFLTAACRCELVTMKIEYIDIGLNTYCPAIEYISTSDWIHFSTLNWIYISTLNWIHIRTGLNIF